MNEQQPHNLNPTMPTLDEIGARWGAICNQALAANIFQEKQLAAQAETIRQLTASEAALLERIKELEKVAAGMGATSLKAAGLEPAAMEYPDPTKQLDLMETPTPEEEAVARANLSAEAAEIARAIRATSAEVEIMGHP